METLQNTIELIKYVGGAGSIASFLTGLVAVSIWKSVKRIINKQELMGIDLEAMDYANEMSSANGYADHRRQKKEELLKNRAVIKGDS